MVLIKIVRGVPFGWNWVVWLIGGMLLGKLRGGLMLLGSQLKNLVCQKLQRQCMLFLISYSIWV